MLHRNIQIHLTQTFHTVKQTFNVSTEKIEMQRGEAQPDKPYTVAIDLESKWLQYQIHSQTHFLFTRCLIWPL